MSEQSDQVKGADQAAGELTPSPGKGRRMQIAGDTVFRATADLADEYRLEIRWLHGHCVDHDLNTEEAGRLIGYDASVVSRVFTGKYQGNLQNVCAQIGAARKLWEERSQGKVVQFVMTKIGQRIFGACDAARSMQRVAFIYGESQIGKTRALEEYRRRNNHGSTVMVRMPAGGGLGHLLDKLAAELRISTQVRERDLRQRIISSFDARMLLIVDEVHEALLGFAEKTVRAVEYLREIHDVSHCGMVLCGTEVFKKEVEHGRFAKVLLQCKRRRMAAIQLPARPSPNDLNVFARAYGLEPATGEALSLQSEVIREEALGMWLTLLRMSSSIALKAKEKLGWEHVSRAYAGLRALEAES